MTERERTALLAQRLNRNGNKCDMCKSRPLHMRLKLAFADNESVNTAPENLLALCYLCLKKHKAKRNETGNKDAEPAGLF